MTGRGTYNGRRANSGRNIASSPSAPQLPQLRMGVLGPGYVTTPLLHGHSQSSGANDSRSQGHNWAQGHTPGVNQTNITSNPTYNNYHLYNNNNPSSCSNVGGFQQVRGGGRGGQHQPSSLGSSYINSTGGPRQQTLGGGPGRQGPSNNYPNHRHNNNSNNTPLPDLLQLQRLRSANRPRVSDREFLQAWGGKRRFMESYGLNFYDADDVETAHGIIDRLRDELKLGRSPYRPN